MAEQELDSSGVQTHFGADGSSPEGATLDFRAVLHAMPGLWVVVKPALPRFIMVAASDGYPRAAMRKPEEILGQDVFEVFPDANPANPESTGEADLRTSLERVLRTRSPHRMETLRYDVQGPDGQWEELYWEALNTPVLGPDGEVQYILQTVENVTARVLAERAAHTAERQLRMAFLQAPALVAVTEGPRHRFVLANSGFEEIVGRGDLVGRTVWEALPELEEQGVFALFDQVYATGEAFVANERRILLPRDDGAEPYEGWYNFVYQPLLDAAGEVTGILQHAVEVTAQVRARMEIEAARDEAERANRAKSEFLTVMSHELRTPLNAISGYVDILDMGIYGPVTEAQRQALGRIQTTQQHLLGLINDVLNYAKLDAGSVRYDITDVPVEEAFASVEMLVAPQVRTAGLTLTRGDVPADLRLWADPEKLRQILLNLLSNAIKFTDPAPERGRIELVCSADGEHVHLHVRDTGIGISADKLETIFDPFVQVRSDLARTAEGTGLGLAISRDLARGMGGDLRVESTPGEGSAFTLTLPRA